MNKYSLLASFFFFFYWESQEDLFMWIQITYVKPEYKHI